VIPVAALSEARITRNRTSVWRVTFAYTRFRGSPGPFELNQAHLRGTAKPRAAAIVLKGSSVLLARRRKAGSEYYALPGGGVEPGETPTRACKRELMEETGLYAETGAEVCVFANRCREEHYFLVTRFRDVPEFGEPERAACGPENRYELVWLKLDALGSVNLKPERLREIILHPAETMRQAARSRHGGGGA
jgi:8-oxo-dGTP diphosphatase